ncbi:hypothetical protein BKA70DRAFT_1272242 [Coprinopsis sp. MPI-PUGE-AT-0042]|nr:hypothetical protein BKA70DRAFT_1272242 [Coprinopsis sp. MPI-PUGE-AT-0042]
MYRKGREIVKRAGRTHHSEEHPVVLTQEVRINGGIFTSAGRDVHTHFYTAPKPEQPQFDLWSVLEPIENFRQIQQDTLSKATPKTGEWIFDYEMFPIWWDPKSDLKTLWGSGIPGAGKTVATSVFLPKLSKPY